MNHSFRDFLGFWEENVPSVCCPCGLLISVTELVSDVVCDGVVTQAAESLGCTVGASTLEKVQHWSWACTWSQHGICQLSCHMKIAAFSHETLYYLVLWMNFPCFLFSLTYTHPVPWWLSRNSLPLLMKVPLLLYIKKPESHWLVVKQPPKWLGQPPLLIGIKNTREL